MDTLTPLYLAPKEAFPLGEGIWPSESVNYATLPPDVVASRANNRLIDSPWGSVLTVEASTLATVSQQCIQYGRFILSPYSGSMSAAGLSSADSIEIADSQSNLAANHCINRAELYLWRPSTGQKIATYRRNTDTTTTPPLPPTSSGGAYFSKITDFTTTTYVYDTRVGDVLVLELFAVFTQTVAASYTTSLLYGGSDATTRYENDSVPSLASKYVLYNYDGAQIPRSLNLLMGEVGGSARAGYAAPPITLVAHTVSSGSCSGVLSSGYSWGCGMAAHPTIASTMDTQILMSSELRSSGVVLGYLPQVHTLSSDLKSISTMRSVGSVSRPAADLLLFYSGDSPSYFPMGSTGGVVSAVPYYSQSIQTIDGTIPGVRVYGGVGFTESDTYTLAYLSGTQELVLSYTGGFSVTTELRRDGYFAVGLNELGYLVLYVTRAELPELPSGTEFTATGLYGSLFSNPSNTDIDIGTVTYRCLYLMNVGYETVTDVQITLSGVALEPVAVGTDASNVNIRAGASPYSLWNLLNRSSAVGGMTCAFSLQTNARPTGGVSFPYLFSGNRTDTSDGIAEAIAIHTDSMDSLDLLTEVVFSSSHVWTEIPPGRGIVVWLRRVVPTALPLPIVENLRIDISATF